MKKYTELITKNDSTKRMDLQSKRECNATKKSHEIGIYDVYGDGV